MSRKPFRRALRARLNLARDQGSRSSVRRSAPSRTAQSSGSWRPVAPRQSASSAHLALSYAKKIIFSSICFLISFNKTSVAREFVRVFLDNKENVHAITKTDKEIILTNTGTCGDPKLSKDGKTVGWLIYTMLQPPIVQEPKKVYGTLIIYKNGTIIQKIRGDGGFIRCWNFFKNDGNVVIYSGALHFGSVYVLYEAKTKKEIERSLDPITKDSPEWAKKVCN